MQKRVRAEAPGNFNPHYTKKVLSPLAFYLKTGTREQYEYNPRELDLYAMRQMGPGYFWQRIVKIHFDCHGSEPFKRT